MTAERSAPLILTMGDPAGCGPQITAATWKLLREDPALAFAVAGPVGLYSDFCDTQAIRSLSEVGARFSTSLPVLDTGPSLTKISPGVPVEASSNAIVASIETAVELTRNGQASAIVTNPINKALLYKAGFKFPGHTELLADLCAVKDTPAPRPVMMLVGGGLRVALATIHMPLIEAARSLSPDMLGDIARIVDTALKRDFGLDKPRIAFTGLNPHAGEDGALGSEEIDIINPAAARLRAEGIDISDARSADTVFAESLNGEYDAVIAMTHDQGLIPVKTLDFWGGVNTTLGLPIIRTSPDHGTAYEAARAGTCRPDSLIAAIKLAKQNSAHRAKQNAKT